MKCSNASCSLAILVSVLPFLASCGGSGGSANLPFLPGQSDKTTITGTVYAAPVAGANVVVLDSNGATVAGPVATAPDGAYSVRVPASVLSSDLVISSSGGTFTDEATATAGVAGGNLAAYVSGGTLSSGSAVHLTPSSTIVADLVRNHGQTLSQATTKFFNAFGYTPDLSLEPVPVTAASTAANAAGRLAGAQAAAFSKVTMDLPLAPEQQFDLLTALADDIADDNKLNASSSAIPGTATPLPSDIMKKFCKAVEAVSQSTSTATYTVVYGNVGMGAKQGKSLFTLTITDTNGPVVGLASSGDLSVEPMMHMSSMDHSTPLESITETAAGVYTVTIYYLMSTAMNGMAMGHWELKVTIGSGPSAESVTFSPYVDMAMGDTPSASLYGPSDIISGMTSVENRKYTLFKETSISVADPKLNLYMVHDEGMKRTFAPVHTGAVLAPPTGEITSITVLASVDKTNWSASPADGGNGHWSLDIPGINGVKTAGDSVVVYLKLIVNGEQKTKDGTTTLDGSNEYASFSATLVP